MKSYVYLPRIITRIGTTKQGKEHCHRTGDLPARVPFAFGLAALLHASWDFGFGDPRHRMIKSNSLFF
jgi:hypothetical protein